MILLQTLHGNSKSLPRLLGQTYSHMQGWWTWGQTESLKVKTLMGDTVAESLRLTKERAPETKRAKTLGLLRPGDKEAIHTEIEFPNWLPDNCSGMYASMLCTHTDTLPKSSSFPPADCSVLLVAQSAAKNCRAYNYGDCGMWELLR